MDKRSKRRECFANIKQMSAAEKAEFSSSIVSHLSTWPAFEGFETVFSYLALPSEPDLKALSNDTPSLIWGYSRVDETDRLRFHEVASEDRLVEGAFGFREPNPANCPEIDPQKADLILIPGVGFDPASGARLGRGKGHYDRFLSATLARNPNVQLVGVCFSTQITALEPEAHDIPMNRVVTERGWEL